MFPNCSAQDLNLNRIISSCHKETQTSNKSLQDSSTATSCNLANSRDKGNVKIYEFNEVVQNPCDPSDITIIKDVFKEEKLNQSSTSKEGSSNRYSYCREIIKPRVKNYPKDCPISDKQLLKDVLNAAHEDFPDYESCFNVDKKGKKTTNEKESVNSIVKNDTPDSSKSYIFGHKTESGKKGTCKKKRNKCNSKDSIQKSNSTSSLESKESSCNIKKPCGHKPKHSDSNKKIICCSVKAANITDTKNTNMDADKDKCPPKPRNPKCPPKSPCADSIAVCKNKGPPPGPPAICENPNPNQEGTSKCKDKSPKDNDSKNMTAAHSLSEESQWNEHTIANSTLNTADDVRDFENPKTYMDTHNTAMATIKLAVEDFFGKVYGTTKEAVSLIRTESVRQLERLTKSSSCNTNNPGQRIHEKSIADPITNLFFQTEDSDTISDTEIIPGLIKVNDENSPFNGNVSDIEQDSDPEDRSMFTVIKSKIVSMFGEPETDDRRK